MTHLDEELLAQWALDGVSPEPDAAEHLATCSTCQAALADLQALTADLRQTPDLETPRAEIWNRITDELNLASPVTVTDEPSPDSTATGTAAVADTPVADTPVADTPVAGTPVADTGVADSAAGGDAARGRRYGRGMLALAAGVAAVLGIGIGLGASTVLDRDGQEPTPAPVAVVRLEPLPGKAGGGTADLIQAGNELQVAVSGLEAQSGYYELWLINADGQRMVSLGVLDPATGGTFRIPDNLTSEGYRIVDISLEPNDGNPEHSRDSVVRGTLPT
ncbi:anti-sigma factor [Kribbella sp. CA-247076]|uniref:anti-sigma factor n=1 Tax=Kribbella sp. CA-247076 TaxID=3239941 RepID=UPI003D9090EE